MTTRSTAHNSTPASRRRFLAFAGAASAVTAGSLAAAAMPVKQTCALASQDDSALVNLERQILQHRDAIAALEPEVRRLDDVWCLENHRLHDEYEATGTGPTFDERKELVDAMPEFKEYMRLRHLQESEREAADGLVREMWKIPAQTAEGRRAKVNVLLSYVMDSIEWRAAEQPEDTYDVLQARDLMIEFVGGPQAEMLRAQFA